MMEKAEELDASRNPRKARERQRAMEGEGARAEKTLLLLLSREERASGKATVAQSLPLSCG